MKSKNKIISGYLEEYKIIKKYRRLYLKCLEKEMAVNKMTVSSFQVIDCRGFPSGVSIFSRGFILSKLFALLGLIIGIATAKNNVIYTGENYFCNGGVGLTEVNSKIYNLLLKELFDIYKLICGYKRYGGETRCLFIY